MKAWAGHFLAEYNSKKILFGFTPQTLRGREKSVCHLPITNRLDAGAIRTDPKFVDPGCGGNGNANGPSFASLEGYRLQAGLPCINKGLVINGNGSLISGEGNGVIIDAATYSIP